MILDRFVVVDKSAKMPLNCWGNYRRVGVVELTAEAQRQGSLPKMLSTRAKAVNRVVDTWENCNVGTTNRCAYRKAVVEANELARDLNKVAQRRRDLP
jgi:predicted ATP-dependent protease